MVDSEGSEDPFDMISPPPKGTDGEAEATQITVGPSRQKTTIAQSKPLEITVKPTLKHQESVPVGGTKVDDEFGDG